MGGRAGWALVAITSTLVLGLAGIGAAGSVVAADKCEGAGLAVPLPSATYAGFPAVVIEITWAEADAAMLQYVVTDSTDPVNEPFSASNATMNAGCTGAAVICGPIEPLTLSSAPTSGRNQAPLRAGRHTIVGAPGGACVYYTGEDGKAEYAKAPKEIPLTATIEYYPSGEQAPAFTKTLAPVMVPTFEELPRDLRPHRRILGSFDWDPASGISNVVAAGASTGSAELEPVPEPEPPPERAWVPESAGGRLREFLGWGRDIPSPDDPRLSDAQRRQVQAIWAEGHPQQRAQRVREWRQAEAARELAAIAEEEWWEEQILPEMLPEDWDEAEPLTPEGLEATGSAELEPVPEPDDASLATTEGSTLDAIALSVPPPVNPPPPREPKADRQWVSLGQAMTVTKDGQTRELSTGVWYQAKEVGGQLRLFDRRGRLLGAVSASDPAVPLVREWEPQAGESS